MEAETKTRLKYGLPIAIVAIALLVVAGAFASFIVLAASLALCTKAWHEYARMMGLIERKALYYPGFFLLWIMTLQAFFLEPGFQSVLFIFVAGFVSIYVENVRIKKGVLPERVRTPEETWREFCRYVFGVIYIFMLFGFLSPLSNLHEGHLLILMCLCMIFVGDSAAYFAGRKWGKTKIWPELSPAKSWEGAGASLLASMFVMLFFWVLFRFTLNTHFSLPKLLIAGMIGSPLAQAGDFMESLMKRASGYKDSGALIPGHGGVLDRMDGFAFAMPFLYYILR